MKAFRKVEVSRAGQRMKERWDAKAYRVGIDRAAEEVQIVCDRLHKSQLGENIAAWLRKLPDDPLKPHPDTPRQES